MERCDVPKCRSRAELIIRLPAMPKMVSLCNDHYLGLGDDVILDQLGLKRVRVSDMSEATEVVGKADPRPNARSAQAAAG